MLAFLLLLPALALVAAFLMAPLGLLVGLSLSPENGAAGLGLGHYARLADWYYANLFLTTLRIGAVVTLVCALLAYPLSYFLARARGAAASIGMFLLVLPLMTSAVIAAFGWMLILGRRGLLNTAVAALGLEPLRLLNTEFAVVLALTQLLLPYMILPLSGSMERISPALEEAARNLGGGAATVWTQVIFPLSLPGLVSGAMLVFSIAISSLIVPAMLGGRMARMVGNDIFEHLLVSFDWPMAAALSVALALVAGALSAAGMLLLRRMMRA